MKNLKITTLIAFFLLSSTSINAQVNKNYKYNPVKINRITPLKTNSKIKAAFVAPNGKHYFFTEKRYFKYSRANGLEKIANSLPNNWAGIPESVDAAFVNPKNKKAYFFKGSKYYRWDFKKGLDNPALAISRFWKGVPNNVDAVVAHPNGKIYFFKGTEYFRYNPITKKVDNSALISTNWKGVPNNVDAALLHANGKIYFFKGNTYYRYNSKLHKVDKTATIGKDGWKGLDFNKKNFTKYIPTKSKIGIDAALYDSPSDEVDFFRGRKSMRFAKQSGTTLVGQGNRIEIYGFNQKMKTHIIGVSNWYSGIPQNIDAATPYFDNSRGTTHLFFKGNNIYFWSKKYGNKGGLNIKQTISRNIPYNIEAAAANESGELYLFKDNKYYVVDQLNQSHQRFQYKTSGKIKNKFPYAPNSMDAARWDYETNTFIFYKGLKYYTHNKVGTMDKRLFK